MSARILLVDDEPEMLQQLEKLISEKTPYEVFTCHDPLEAPGLVSTTPCDLVIADLEMPGMNGVDLLKKIKQLDENAAVIIMAEEEIMERAIEAMHMGVWAIDAMRMGIHSNHLLSMTTAWMVEAMRTGVFDYITKPFQWGRIVVTIEQVLEWRHLKLEIQRLQHQLEDGMKFGELVGTSRAMKQVYEQIKQVAKTSATVLITCESGCGKELVDRTIHALSPRKDHKFVPVNCSALPESLIESELFGHLKGSFTGATRDRKGLVDEADQGTLFIDEVGDLSLTVEIKLLRLMQAGEYKIIGDTRTRNADVRFISATHQDLWKKVQNKTFRKDFYYRLNVYHIRIPALRDRKEDIPLLANQFLREYVPRHGKSVSAFTPEAVMALESYDWPGNVRELENVIERAVIVCSEERISGEDLSTCLASTEAAPKDDLRMAFMKPYKDAKDEVLADFNQRYISYALAKSGGNVSEAAKKIGLQRQQLHRLIKDYDIQAGRFRDKPGG